MNPSAAMALAAELASAYPGRGVGELTLSQYAQAFEEAVPDRAVLAVGDLVRQMPNRAPTLGQVREALRLRDAFPQLQLPAHEDLGYGPPQPFPADHWAHGKYHLSELLAVTKEQRTDQMREMAQHPNRCDCEMRSSRELG